MTGSIHIDTHRLPPYLHATRVGWSILMSWGWITIGPAIVLIIWGALADWRLAVVGLALLLVVAPAALAMAYITSAMTLEARRAVYPRQVDVTPQGITFTYEPLTEGGPTLPPLKLATEQILRADAGNKAVYLIYGRGRQAFEAVPRTVVTPEQWRDLIVALTSAPNQVDD